MTSDVTTKPKVRVGYTNPAFRAMGIPSLKLPSRNWMIFWSVVTVSVSGILYDKQKQKQIRNHYQDIVKPLSDKSLAVDVKARKITVFIAPPPNDYLDTSLKIWRRYIKPILYYAGVDYEVIQEEKQGVIRTEVANRMRALRKQLLDSSEKIDPAPQKEISLDEYDREQARKYKAEFDFRDVLGPFHGKPKPVIKDEDSLTCLPQMAGGVICLGRGAYKEYITGLHEGLLGPLEPPQLESVEGPKEESAKLAGTENEKDMTDESIIKTEESSSELRDAEQEAPKQASKIPKPAISPEEYSNVEIPQELSLSYEEAIVRDPNTNVPILLHQPVLTIPISNLIGFLNIPERIYRFYQKRYYCETICSAVTNLVEQRNIRPFVYPKDFDLAVEEEEDWPQGWVKEGIKRGSEWTAELKGDARIVKYINLYNEGSEE